MCAPASDFATRAAEPATCCSRIGCSDRTIGAGGVRQAHCDINKPEAVDWQGAEGTMQNKSERVHTHTSRPYLLHGLVARRARPPSPSITPRVTTPRRSSIRSTSTTTRTITSSRISRSVRAPPVPSPLFLHPARPRPNARCLAVMGECVSRGVRC